MHLTAPMFDRLLASLGPRTSQGTEQRCAERLPTSALAVLVPIGEADSVLRVRVVDLSPQGIGILNRKPLSVGSEFLVRIPQEGEERPIFVRCSVRSCTAAGDGLFRIGSEFSELDEVGPCLLGLSATDFE